MRHLKVLVWYLKKEPLLCVRAPRLIQIHTFRPQLWNLYAKQSKWTPSNMPHMHIPNPISKLSSKLHHELGNMQPATSTAEDGHEPLPSPIERVLLNSWDTYEFYGSADALTNWLNERWTKTGYHVSKETVCFTLKANGKDASIGVEDPLDGELDRPRKEAKFDEIR